MADPTPQCPDPEAPDFLRCLAAWDLHDLDPFTPFVVFYRVVKADGTYSEAEVDRAIRRYRHRPKQRKTIFKQGE